MATSCDMKERKILYQESWKFFYYPGWNCLNFLQVFVGYQANFSWFYEILKETSIKTSLMQFNFITLPIRCILNLAEILSCEVLQFS